MVQNCRYYLEDAVVEGDAPFKRTHGMRAFSYASKDSRSNEVFNSAMYNHTSLVMKRLLQVCNGFEGVKDVGGGFGATLACIISKYPNTWGVNFDLPHVIQNAPPHPGVEHVSGDMFESIPEGEVILLKESGKVTVVESIVPEKGETDLLSTIALQSDLSMMIIHPGGKERTEKEFEDLAKEAGFTFVKLVCLAYSDWVIEFHKNRPQFC